MLRRKKHVKHVKRRTSIASVVCLIAGGICLAVGAWQYLPDVSNEWKLAKLRKEVVFGVDPAEESLSADTKQINWKELKEVNEDIVGWISIPGTPVDMPVLHCESSSYYLKHDFTGAYNPIGAAFVQPEMSEDLTDQHLVIYGHNVSRIFGTIHNYEASGYMSTHRIGYLYTPDRTVTLHFYSTYNCYDGSRTYETRFRTEQEWEEWKHFTKESSSYEISENNHSADASEGQHVDQKADQKTDQKTDQVVTLSTCSGRGQDRKLRYVLHAVTENMGVETTVAESGTDGKVTGSATSYSK